MAGNKGQEEHLGFSNGQERSLPRVGSVRTPSVSWQHHDLCIPLYPKPVSTLPPKPLPLILGLLPTSLQSCSNLQFQNGGGGGSYIWQKGSYKLCTGVYIPFPSESSFVTYWNLPVAVSGAQSPSNTSTVKSQVLSPSLSSEFVFYKFKFNFLKNLMYYDQQI